MQWPWHRKEPRRDIPPASDRTITSPPVGHLVRHADGQLTGVQGTAYDYVLGSDGLYVQAKSELLSARIPVGQRIDVKGLAPVRTKIELRQENIPKEKWTAAELWICLDPGVERTISITRDGGKYQLYAPEQTGSPGSLVYAAVKKQVLQIHSHGRAPAFFSWTDNQDEQGFCLYGVVGNADKPPRERSRRYRVGIYGHFYTMTEEEIQAITS